jgi:serine O-acetyltransferase
MNSHMPQSETSLTESLTLWQQVVEDWIAHGKDWTKPGFRAVAVHRFGVWRMSLKPKLLRAPFSLLYRMMFHKVRNTYGIELPYTVKLGRRVVIEHQSAIVIHGYSEIGDDCILRQGVTLGNRYLNKPLDAPRLGIGVNVGAGAKIFGAVTIGNGSNIGANAVVLQDVPEGATAVGIPAKVVNKSPEHAALGEGLEFWMTSVHLDEFVTSPNGDSKSS